MCQRKMIDGDCATANFLSREDSHHVTFRKAQDRVEKIIFPAEHNLWEKVEQRKSFNKSKDSRVAISLSSKAKKIHEHHEL